MSVRNKERSTNRLRLGMGVRFREVGDGVGTRWSKSWEWDECGNVGGGVKNTVNVKGDELVATIVATMI